jgi:hypothetical protein
MASKCIIKFIGLSILLIKRLETRDDLKIVILNFNISTVKLKTLVTTIRI